ncbi:hypothetical protein ARSEF4850_008197 [Beauveria asiatica]
MGLAYKPVAMVVVCSCPRLKSGQHIYDPYGARKIKVAAARVTARKLIPAPEAVLASGMVGTGGPNDEDAEGAEEGNTVTEELFPGQRGAPEGAGALFVVLELTFAEDMAVARLADGRQCAYNHLRSRTREACMVHDVAGVRFGRDASTGGKPAYELLETVEIGRFTPAPLIASRGVLAEIVDEAGCSLPPPALLWVLDKGDCLELWYDINQRPQLGDPAHKTIRDVIGHHEDAFGDVYYAVLWEGYLCPGWVSDEDLSSHTLVSDYWLAQRQDI